ncbi:cytochrome P450 [Gymnodinialimonas sp.]
MDFYSDNNVADPVPAYRKMLSHGPVVWLPRNGLFAICGHGALTAALRNTRVFASGKGVSVNEDVNARLIGSTLNSDPPQHDVTRAITFAPLTPKALQAVRDRVEFEARVIAERVTAQGSFDAAAELAPYLPLRVVRDLVGLSGEGKENMLEWGAATFELMGDPRERRAAAWDGMRALRAYLDDPATLDALSPGGMANQAMRRGLAQGMDVQKATALMRDYIAPSLDTTISAIGYAMMLFAQHPEEWARLREDRTLVKNAIEEVVRLNTPIKAFSRYITEDTEVAGFALPQGKRVLMVYGAANRDPAQFVDPDRFDITRTTRGHVGFGHGVHACLGMHLARLEMTCLFNALADRIERFELAGPIVPAINSTIHALASVPVRITA